MTKSKPTYHHGSLPEALLDAAERILVEEGLHKLSLRAIARLAGVSHAAPKNHFENLTGLLSALAARGFNRFGNEITERLEQANSSDNKLKLVGLAYVAFARDNPELFLLMFRSHSLDYNNPELGKAAGEALSKLSAHSVNSSDIPKQNDGPPSAMIRSWSMVHGFAMLMIDGRLEVLLGDKHSSLSDEQLYEILFAD